MEEGHGSGEDTLFQCCQDQPDCLYGKQYGTCNLHMEHLHVHVHVYTMYMYMCGFVHVQYIYTCMIVEQKMKGTANDV